MYKIMFYGGMVGALVTLAISIVIFIKADVWQVIKDLLGIRTVKEKHKKGKNVVSNTTSIKPKPITESVNKTITVSGLDNSENIIVGVEEKTETTFILDEETSVLTGHCETELFDDVGETELLDEDSEETVLLSGELHNDFSKEIDIMIINSNISI